MTSAPSPRAAAWAPAEDAQLFRRRRLGVPADLRRELAHAGPVLHRDGAGHGLQVAVELLHDAPKRHRLGVILG